SDFRWMLQRSGSSASLGGLDGSGGVADFLGFVPMSGLLGHAHPSQLRVPRNRVRFNLGQSAEGAAGAGGAGGAGAGGAGSLIGPIGAGIGGGLTLASLINSIVNGSFDNSKTGAIPQAGFGIAASALPVLEMLFPELAGGILGGGIGGLGAAMLP